MQHDVVPSEHVAGACPQEGPLQSRAALQTVDGVLEAYPAAQETKQDPTLTLSL